MSLILDALKRAERERRLERPPDLTAVYEEDHLQRKGIRPWLWLSGVLLVGVIVAWLILWPDGPDPGAPVVPTESSIARSTSETDPAGKAEARPSPASPDSSASKPPGPPPAQTPPPQPASALMHKTPAAQPPKTAGETGVKALPETGSKPAGQTADVKRQPTDKGISPAPAPPVLTSGETEPAEPAAPQTATDPDSINEMDGKAMVDEPPPPPSQPADGRRKASRGKPPSIPLLSELPFEVRQKLGNLQINVHSYSEKPAERLVFINMKNFKVGDQIGENGPVLKEITSDGAIIDYGEGQARLQVWR
ncbi:MAG: general secretion pathway protein GspB [Candidatus Desulfacyla sp.]